MNPSSTQARTAVITVKSTSGKITRNITLTQSASSSYLNLSTDNTDGILDFSETAGSLDVSVFSNTNWTIEGVDDQWVSLSKTSGNGESKVRITVTANLNVKERKNVLTFKGDGVSPKQLTVRQAQATYHVTVSSPQVSNITSNTASITFSYDSNVAITSYGVCYSTTDNPNIESAQYVLKTGSTNQGSPTIQLTGLSPETLYYVRAFALMQNQTEVNYSEKSVSFSTTANEPGVNDNKTPEPIN